MTMTHNIHNMDCMELMRSFPDKHFDLAVVDPPYGVTNNLEIGFGDKKSGRINRANKWGEKDWDKERPTNDYFNELFRVSKNQIIWGGNYFADMLPKSEKWLVWDKMQRVNQSDCELAYTSFKGALRIYQYHCSKLQGFQNPNRFHPTEKPIALYDWIFKNYLPNGGKVLDTHGGSMSSVISAIKAGNIEMTCSELDNDYFKAAKERILTFQSQLDMFAPPADIIFHQ
jgi:site-specific DNA-methyltransferase (adenine-specific)